VLLLGRVTHWLFRAVVALWGGQVGLVEFGEEDLRFGLELVELGAGCWRGEFGPGHQRPG
jgi:hypothetical protein